MGVKKPLKATKSSLDIGFCKKPITIKGLQIQRPALTPDPHIRGQDTTMVRMGVCLPQPVPWVTHISPLVVALWMAKQSSLDNHHPRDNHLHSIDIVDIWSHGNELSTELGMYSLKRKTTVPRWFGLITPSLTLHFLYILRLHKVWYSSFLEYSAWMFGKCS